ncbi:MAG: peptidylprolyl isomerase [Clostridia bacterium]|nr:peptidylprolyl isomerase [Clostridia bacterium]
MNMKKNILILSLALLLSACGGKSTDVTVATVGDYEITKSQFEFYLNSVKQQMQGTEISSEEDWENTEIDGKKAIDVAKEQALDIALTNIAYIEIFEKEGYKLDSEAKDKIKQSKDSIVSQYEQNGGYDAFLEQSGIDDSFVDLLCESMYCSDVLYENFSADYKLDEGEVDKFFEENAADIAKYRTAKHVLILTQNMDTGEVYDEAKKAEAKKKAEEIYQRALKGEDFDTLVSENSEDPGSLTNPDGYTFTDGEMVAEFQNCVDSLKPGEIGFVESSFGYHIIKRLELNMDYFRPTVENSITVQDFNEHIENKISEYSITLVENDA